MNKLLRTEFEIAIVNTYKDIIASGIVIPSYEEMINLLDERVTNKFEIHGNRIDIVTDPYGVSRLQCMSEEEFYRFLVNNHLFLSYKGNLINQPIVEVWR
ncbi:hypothetical protein [Priestia megaterium]|uniref:hypothetical protein n=1 Tax=Priestia megaterium TaxID=1404 RepID=UPI002798DDC4|nr:hypothetical protein [Priestia megaterium]MEB4887651.1 hypothetical protein [Priestia megaterium]WDC91266.1 hypothetical protein PSR56_27375 [Priestia megaterium]